VHRLEQVLEGDLDELLEGIQSWVSARVQEEAAA
jgi:hypothetical protein